MGAQESTESARKQEPKDFLFPPINELDPVGTLELNERLPFIIAEYHSSMLVWKYPNSDLHLKSSQKLVSLSYYAACKQLYHTLDDVTKFHLRQFEGLIHKTIELPENLSKSILIIGNFNTSYGRVVIKNPVVTFKRWLIAGLEHDPERPSEPNSHNDFTDPYKLVWKDTVSKELVDDLCLKYIASKSQNYFATFSDGKEYMLSLPKITKENYKKWIESIFEGVPFSEELISVGKLFGLRSHEWISYNNNSELLKGLGTIGCRLCLMEDRHVSECLEKSMETYETNTLKSTIHSNFSTSIFKPNESGSFAQTMHNTKDSEILWKIPIDDISVINDGFMFNPCKSMSFNLLFKTYSRKSREETRYAYAKEDMI